MNASFHSKLFVKKGWEVSPSHTQSQRSNITPAIGPQSKSGYKASLAHTSNQKGGEQTECQLKQSLYGDAGLGKGRTGSAANLRQTFCLYPQFVYCNCKCNTNKCKPLRTKYKQRAHLFWRVLHPLDTSSISFVIRYGLHFSMDVYSHIYFRQQREGKFTFPYHRLSPTALSFPSKPKRNRSFCSFPATALFRLADG